MTYDIYDEKRDITKNFRQVKQPEIVNWALT